MAALKYLANLGYGTRREVRALLAQRRVTDANGRVVGPDDRVAHDDLRVDGAPLDPPPGSVLLLHKPVGYVCSTADAHNPVIYALLPDRFRRRSPVIAPVGRLDLDTSGLLLLTDDGSLNHRLTSPRSHVAKVYEAELHEPLRGDETQVFGSGTLLLAGDPDPLAPASLDILDARRVRVTIVEGRYHQVRRMFAAVGNHVVTLRRVQLGPLTLGDLPTGSWRVLTAEEREQLVRPIESSPPRAP